MKKEEQRMSTSDLVAAADRAEARRVPVTDPGDAGDVIRDERSIRMDGRAGDGEAHAPLFVAADAEGYRTRWSAIQTGFVDEPRRAVEEADALVAEVVKQLAESFADERRQLEAGWERNDKVSTEDLRQAMRRYRSFFERLLTV